MTNDITISDQYIETTQTHTHTQVQLSYLLEREGGWEAEQDWMDILSGGEKQRMAVSHLYTLRLVILCIYRIVLCTLSQSPVCVCVCVCVCRWLDCSTMSLSLLYWMNALVQLVWMLRDSYTPTAER